MIGLIKKTRQPHELLWNIESIEEQADSKGFEAGIYDFRKGLKPGWDYFNCGVADRVDGRWLVVRRSIRQAGNPIGQNDVVAFRLQNNMPEVGFPVNLGKRMELEHFEDPRVIVHEGRTFVAACNFVMPNPKSWTGAHQIISEVTKDWKIVRRHDIDFGGNGKSISTRKVMQKNWLPFFHERQMHIVFWAQPHTVLRCDADMNVVEKTQSDSELVKSWKFGEIRGGTPPVMVNGECWTFFHSSTPWTVDRRHYHMGAYAFEAKPPFAITKISKLPILSGSRRNYWQPGKPMVVFACGSVFNGKNWIVTGGSNDLECFWADIPHELVVRSCA